MPFVHLRAHTEYSVVDGTLRVDELVAAAADDQQVALAITDLGNVFGALKFYRAARKAGIKPVIGADVWLQPEPGDRAPSRLLLLVQNPTGYRHLCELLTRCWSGAASQPQAWTTWDALAEFNAGLIVLSGADGGAIGQALIAGDEARAPHHRTPGGPVPEPLLPGTSTRRAAGAGGAGGGRSGAGR
jgi:DNA polymerase-3 subunit alpha